MFSILGNIHQADSRFGGLAGMQCTAIAYTALVLAFLSHIPTPSWNSHVIDSLVNEGNQIYNDILIRSDTNHTPHYLLHRELPPQLTVGNDRIKAYLYRDIYFGSITQHVDNRDIALGYTLFHDALNGAFAISEFNLLTVSSSTIAVFQSYGHFYVFDSHSRNEYGRIAPDGSAVLLCFTSLDEVHHYLLSVYNTVLYEITPIMFENTAPNSYQTDNINQNSGSKRNTTLPSHVSNESNSENTPPKKKKKKVAPNCKKNEFKQPCPNSFGNDFIWANFTANIRKQFENKVRNTSTHDHAYTKHSHEEYSPWNSNKTNEVNNCTSYFNDTALGSNFEQENGTETNTNDTFDFLQSNRKNFLRVKNKYQVFKESTDIPTTNHSYPVKKRLHEKKKKENYNCHEKLFIETIRQIPDKSCRSCRKFLFPSEVYTLNSTSERVPDLQQGDVLCQLCKNYIHKNKMPYGYVQGNNLHVPDQPPELKNLSITDKRFVSKLHTFMTLLVLPRGGQYAQTGMAIHFEAPIQEIINDFPCINNLNGFVPVVNAHNQDKVLHMNMDKVLKALYWLKAYNHLYTNINIKEPAYSNVQSEIDDDLTEYGAIATNVTLPDTNIPTFLRDGKIVLPHLDNAPVYMDKIQYGEEMSFPYLFPSGRNGLNENRSQKLSHKQYFQHRIYDIDARWRTNISYLLNAVNMFERQQLLETVNVAMKWRTSVSGGGTLRNSNITGSSNNPDMTQDSYMFAKKIRGTAAYWKNKLVNLLAMIKCLGPPTIFLTLSANDNHWPELAMMYTGLSYEDLQDINMQENLRKDPLFAAIHFERRWNAFLKYLKDAQPLGEIVDFFSRIEFQSRGSVHLHSFFYG